MAPAAPLREILRRPGVPAAVIAALASFAVMAAVMNLTGYIVVGHHHAQADVFTVISLHIVGMYALVLVIGALVDRVGRRPTLLWGLAVMAFRRSCSPSPRRFCGRPSRCSCSGSAGISYISATAELVTHATPVERGRLVGFTDLAAGLLAARSRCSAASATRSGVSSPSPWARRSRSPLLPPPPGRRRPTAGRGAGARRLAERSRRGRGHPPCSTSTPEDQEDCRRVRKGECHAAQECEHCGIGRADTGLSEKDDEARLADAETTDRHGKDPDENGEGRRRRRASRTARRVISTRRSAMRRSAEQDCCNGEAGGHRAGESTRGVSSAAPVLRLRRAAARTSRRRRTLLRLCHDGAADRRATTAPPQAAAKVRTNERARTVSRVHRRADRGEE